MEKTNSVRDALKSLDTEFLVKSSSARSQKSLSAKKGSHSRPQKKLTPETLAGKNHGTGYGGSKSWCSTSRERQIHQRKQNEELNSDKNVAKSFQILNITLEKSSQPEAVLQEMTTSAGLRASFSHLIYNDCLSDWIRRRHVYQPLLLLITSVYKHISASDSFLLSPFEPDSRKASSNHSNNARSPLVVTRLSSLTKQARVYTGLHQTAAGSSTRGELEDGLTMCLLIEDAQREVAKALAQAPSCSATTAAAKLGAEERMCGRKRRRVKDVDVVVVDEDEGEEDVVEVGEDGSGSDVASSDDGNGDDDYDNPEDCEDGDDEDDSDQNDDGDGNDDEFDDDEGGKSDDWEDEDSEEEEAGGVVTRTSAKATSETAGGGTKRGREKGGDGTAAGVGVAEERRYAEVMGAMRFEAVELSPTEASKLPAASGRGRGYAPKAPVHPSPPGHMARLAAELASMAGSLPVHWSSSILVRADEARPHVLKALIVGPEDTPYANGLFEFDIVLPPDYPNTHPQVQLVTTGGGRVRFNPNLYEDGKVCLSLLGTWSGPGWVPGQSSLLQVLVSIQSLILVENPYRNEPGLEESKGEEVESYNRRVRKETIKWAISEHLKHPPPAFAQAVDAHFRLKRAAILRQINNWRLLAKGKDKFEAFAKALCRLLASLKPWPEGAAAESGLVKKSGADESHSLGKGKVAGFGELPGREAASGRRTVKRGQSRLKAANAKVDCVITIDSDNEVVQGQHVDEVWVVDDVLPTGMRFKQP